MIIPRYWSEAKKKVMHDGKSWTVMRFGWSDESEASATRHAEDRLEKALQTLQQTGEVRKRDHKVSYNGAEGIPIREEIISVHDDIVISRNAYGALCLNTPDVMFADIDTEDKRTGKPGLFSYLFLAVLLFSIGYLSDSNLTLTVGILVVIGYIFNSVRFQMQSGKPSSKQKVLENIRQYSSDNPETHLRIYETPNGLRILFMDKTYKPDNESSLQLLKKLNSDPVYIQMCRNQHCFRARLTPKPWRIGVDRIRPTPGIWPIRSEWMGDRKKWIEKYERRSENYAACRFIEKLGSDMVCEKAEKVRALHDEMSKASQSTLSLA